ncbi:MAG TPA: 16S rRNA (guanine(966)-N(2))-methyltransferase RsmD [Solirubrobacteraceae bacterium]|nr:16S rRNA (guanine(966)-N(2))-methyltransferase RsmD [Solirubrobacteraceae bacterium]
MRVIAGRLGGRRLSAPPGRTTRPTSDRVREALFSMLGELDGAVALDLFAGSGALGIEALSRGARRVVFVERDASALAALRANLASLGLGEEQAQVRAGDALRALRAARARRETYDLVFVDPPYRRASELGSGCSVLLPALLSPGARVVVESDRRAPAELALQTIARRRYGDTTITIQCLPADGDDGCDDVKRGQP